MKQRIFMMLAAMLLSVGAFAQNGTLKGDVNNDGKVDVADVVAVIDIIMKGGGQGSETKAYYWFVGKDGEETPFDANHIEASDSESAGWRMESSKPNQIHPEVFDFEDWDSKWCIIVPTEWGFTPRDTGGLDDAAGWTNGESITVSGVNHALTKWVQKEAQGGVNAVFK